jgi:hypothetical protein
MAIQNMETGNFVNAQQNYFAAPQQLNAQGQVIGHSHVVIEALTSLAQITPSDPNKFAFFKGLNSAAVNGILTADVTAGLPAGAYKMCSINSAANHQPVIVPVAQHGSLDDCSYFSVSDSGEAPPAANTPPPAAVASQSIAAASIAASGAPAQATVAAASVAASGASAQVTGTVASVAASGASAQVTGTVVSVAASGASAKAAGTAASVAASAAPAASKAAGAVAAKVTPVSGAKVPPPAASAPAAKSGKGKRMVSY